MSLREDLQTDLKEMYDNDLSDAVSAFVLEQLDRSSSTYDASAGINTKSITSYDSRGIFTNYGEIERFNTHIEPTDVKLIIIQNEIEVEPSLRDYIIWLEKKYRIISFARDPIQSIYELSLRGIES